MDYDIGHKDAVFTTNFSFFATAEVISHIGATPIFVDVDPDTYNINPDLLENKIKLVLNDKQLNPKAIIAVDLFGQIADYSKLEKIGFKQEGICRSYLKIDGKWQDHILYSLLSDYYKKRFKQSHSN